MKYRDHDDPEIFKECVSAITLQGRPQGLLEEWLSESEVTITVAPGTRKGLKKARPWLAVKELDRLPWTSKVREAVIESDHLEKSSGLFMLSNGERITIFVPVFRLGIWWIRFRMNLSGSDVQILQMYS